MKRGSHMTEEQQAVDSAAHLGLTASPETRAKMSAAHMGHPFYWPWSITDETRAKLSATHLDSKPCIEWLEKLHVQNWKGGIAANRRRTKARRRGFGFAPLNGWFTGCEAHHVNPEQIIYMPKKLHRSIFHRQTDGLGMAKINAIAWAYLTEDRT